MATITPAIKPPKFPAILLTIKKAGMTDRAVELRREVHEQIRREVHEEVYE